MEDIDDDLRLNGIDLALAAHQFSVRADLSHDLIAIGSAAGGHAGLRATALAAAHLGGKILEEDGIHRALEADMQFRYFTLRQGEDLDIEMAETFVQGRGIRLPAREAIERFDDQDVKVAGAGIRQQSLHAWAIEDVAATDSGIGIFPHDLGADLARLLTAQPDLVLDRMRGLKV